MEVTITQVELRKIFNEERYRHRVYHAGDQQTGIEGVLTDT
jgi:hypothetical protein